VLLLGVASACAQTNQWTKPSNGNWEEPFWSLGALPSQTNVAVAIGNPGFKAVAIGGATVANFFASLTISNLTVSAPPGSGNLLLMNYSGLLTPLRILNNFHIGENGHLLHLYAALRVEGRNGGAFIVDGIARHAELATLAANRVVVGAARAGQYYFTNGTFTAVNLMIASNAPGIFSQSGGSVAISNELSLGTFNPAAPVRGDYMMHAGNLSTPTLFEWRGYFAQFGGTNQSASIILVDGVYELAGGLLISQGVQMGWPIPAESRFLQTGGRHQNLAGITIRADNAIVRPGAVYTLQAGQITTPTVLMSWFARFIQNGGTNSVADLRVGLPECDYFLNGGLLSTLRSQVGSGTADEPKALIVQNGGIHRADSELDVMAGDYELKGGTLIAPHILLSGSGLHLQGGQVINSLRTTMTYGRLIAERGDANFGPLLVAGDRFAVWASRIEFKSEAATVRFADSSAMLWSNGVPLIIHNWAGALQGGGAHRIYFGTSSSGLSAMQLAEVFFSNPGGLLQGVYRSRLLPSGELVPARRIPLTFTRNRDEIVLQWPTHFLLQTSTNVMGPYEDLFVSSPYTIRFTDPQRFFRLRSQWTFLR
jgi:hypothetical protein